MLEIFGIHLRLIPLTSSVASKHSASIMEAEGSARPDMFLPDPVGNLLQSGEERLQQLLFQARIAKGDVVAHALWISDGMFGLIDIFRHMFGGQSSGALGYGDFGRLMAMVQSLMSMTAAIVAFILKLPLQAVGWIPRKRLQLEMDRERQHVLNQVSHFF